MAMTDAEKAAAYRRRLKVKKQLSDAMLETAALVAHNVAEAAAAGDVEARGLTREADVETLDAVAKYFQARAQQKARTARTNKRRTK